MDAIQPVSARAQALLSRKLQRAPETIHDFLRLSGAVDMLAALDYHCDNIQRVEAIAAPRVAGEAELMRVGFAAPPTSPEESRRLRAALFEVNAYLATLGRLYYFVKWAAQLNATPTITRLVVFRHKAAAHRSIDQPRGESPELLSLHALSMSSPAASSIGPLGNRCAWRSPIRSRRSVE